MYILLNPGPVNLSERVRRALNGPDICHREEEFSRLQAAIRRKLLEVYDLDEDWAAILLTGSGTAAMEAMLCSLAGKTDRVLIVENGVYGERLARIAAIHGIDHYRFHHPWGGRIDLDRLAGLLGDGFTAIAMVHHETTTGRLNDVASVAGLAAEYRLPLLLDGVSSFGAEEIRFRDWNVAACAGTANKCLHGVPGISFVIVNRDFAGKVRAEPRSLYLDLAAYLQQQDVGGTPFTQSVQTLYALNEALDEHREEGGLQQRRASYRKRMAIVREGLAGMGIRPLMANEESSCVLHSFYLPARFDYRQFHDRLKEHGFIIYAGQGELANSIFRVSLMGAIGEPDARRFVDTVREILA